MTPFAALETRLGERTARKLADATLTVGAATVDGTLDVSVSEQFGLRGNRAQFVCLTDDLGSEVLAEGTAVSVTKNAVTTSYTVALHSIDVAFGQSIVELKRVLI